MKELKFRAFHKPTKIMFNVVQMDFMNKVVFSYERIRSMSRYPYFDTVSYLSSECELMQFTGLKDSTQFQELTKEEQENWLKSNKQEDWRGKEIFEGDILSFNFSEYYPNPDYSKPVYVVELFRDVFPCARGIHENMYAHWHSLPFTKILGNIHQNSELLECEK